MGSLETEKTQKIHVVTGKGGVGKSTIAASLAYALAQSEAKPRVLLVELNETSFYRHLFEMPEIGFSPKNWNGKFDIAVWDSKGCLRDYVLHLVKIERIYKLFFENEVTRKFIEIAPGLKELSLLGKMTSGIRNVGPKLDYDHVVVDSYSSGHTLSMLRAPYAMKSVISKGPMGKQSAEISQLLKDSNIFNYYVVTLPEDLPVTEAIELQEGIESITEINVRFILNKVWEVPVPLSRLQALSEPSFQDFIGYLKNKIQQYELAVSKLKESGRNLTELSYRLDCNSNLDLVSQISQGLAVDG